MSPSDQQGARVGDCRTACFRHQADVGTGEQRLQKTGNFLTAEPFWNLLDGDLAQRLRVADTL